MYVLRVVVASVALATVVGNIVKEASSGLPASVTQLSNGDISTIARPIDISSLPIDICELMKARLGIHYDELKGEQEPDLNHLTLDYKTRNSLNNYNINEAAELIPKTHGYNPKQDVFIFLHGFTDDPGKFSFAAVSAALLNHGEFNVLALDASSLIRWLYVRSSTYVQFIGEKLGSTLASLVKNGVNPKRIYLIGHSLGSHIAGFTGKKFTELTGKRIGRITGLDPAGPCFNKVEEALRLNSTDADYVDVIHTDGGFYGLKTTCGQVDYFVNGGSEQPDCLMETCSHNRVWELYAESVRNHKAFPAVKCKDWEHFKDGRCNYKDVSYMGFGSNPGTTGRYYLQTNGMPPFGRGEKGLTYERAGLLRIIGDVLNP